MRFNRYRRSIRRSGRTSSNRSSSGEEVDKLLLGKLGVVLQAKLYLSANVVVNERDISYLFAFGLELCQLERVERHDELRTTFDR